MASTRKRGKNHYYSFTDADGRRVHRRGCSNKRVTEEMAREAESRVARIKAGLVDSKAERMAEAGRRPIREHLKDFIDSMVNGGRNAQHVAQTRTYIERVLTYGRVERLPELIPSAITTALGTLKETGLSARSLAAHVVAAKSFSHWAWRDGRTVDYSLVGATTPKTQHDRRRVRRPLSETELRALLEATRTAPAWRGMTGLDRAMLYLVASMTGLRRTELGSLTPESFRLDDEVPTIVCAAAYTKNGKQAEQPIPPQTAAALRGWLACKPHGRPVFALTKRTALMLKLDLSRVGIAAEDDQGQHVDMHSLRHGYISTLAKAGVPMKTLQSLARHSDPKLTMNVYSHLTLHDTAAALDALPDLSRPIEPRAARATGTDGVHINNGFGAYLAHAGDVPGRSVTDTDVNAQEDQASLIGRKSLKMSGFDASGRCLTQEEGRVGDGIRTRDVQIHNLVP